MASHNLINLIATSALIALVSSLPVPCSGSTPTLTQEDWAAVPEIEPVWVLKVDGDSARILRNEFLDHWGQPAASKRFPAPLVHVGKTVRVSREPLRYLTPHRWLEVQADGTLRDAEIDWLEQPDITGPGERVGRSMIGRLALFAHDGLTQVRGHDGELITEIPYAIVWCLCFDPQERILAVARQIVEVDGSTWELNKVLMLDYAGNLLHEGDWTECSVGYLAMGVNPHVFQFSLEECRSAGDYLVRLDESRTYSLPGLPGAARCFSPDSRHVLVNKHGEFSFYDASNPESLQLLWQRDTGRPIQAVAVSDARKFIAYRSVGRSEEYLHIGVLSGIDGSPLCRLLQRLDQPAKGPLAFKEDYLFSGMGFAFRGGTHRDTECVHIFDLSAVTPMLPPPANSAH